MKIKINLSIILWACIHIASYSQSTGITQQTRWSEIATGENPENPLIYRYAIEGDTVIHSQEYYKLLKDKVFCVALREDESQQVFVYFPDTEQEELLYDFNWENESNSIRLFNNKPYAIRESEEGKIIQGIGSLNGFFSPIATSEEQPVELLCYWRNEQLLYLNPNYTNCEGGKTYKSCFGKEFTKYTVIANQPAGDRVGSVTYTINGQLEISGYPSSVRFYFIEDLSSGKINLIYDEHYYGAHYYYEYPIMNLNVWIGDIVPLDIPSAGGCFENLSYDYDFGYFTVVDSIYFENNRKHIRMATYVSKLYSYPSNEEPFLPFLFVEGRGPNTGLTARADYMNCTNLLCYETESEFYRHPLFDECYYLEVGINTESISKSVKVIQTGQTLQIRFANPFSGVLFLYNNLGQKQMDYTIKNSIETTLDIKHLSQGSYILQFWDENTATVQTVKIIIH